MREYNKKTCTRIENILTKVKCDICGKEINNGEQFYRVSTSHSDWGNDSCDSYEYFDICSDNCIKEKMEQYFKYNSYTKRIEIEKETLYIKDVII